MTIDVVVWAREGVQERGVGGIMVLGVMWVASESLQSRRLAWVNAASPSSGDGGLNSSSSSPGMLKVTECLRVVSSSKSEWRTCGRAS